MEDQEIRRIREEIAELKRARVEHEARMDAIEQGIAQVSKTAYGYDQIHDRGFDMHQDEINDIWSSIKNLEFAVFPNLVHDLNELHKVIGETEPGPEHPAERRIPKNPEK